MYAQVARDASRVSFFSIDVMRYLAGTIGATHAV